MKTKVYPIFILITRILLGLIFIIASIDKIIDPAGFARDISKNSKVLVIIVNQKQDLVNFFKNNLKGNEIVIGMGAGSISSWLKELKNFLK